MPNDVDAIQLELNFGINSIDGQIDFIGVGGARVANFSHEPKTDADLVAFAKALKTEGVELWTSNVNTDGDAISQLSVFQEGEHFLPIHEVFNYDPDELGDNRFTPTMDAVAEGISESNIWIWPDGSKSDGSVLSLEDVSLASGVAIPSGDSPTIVSIPDMTVAENSPVHIALDGYDPNGDPLTYSITIADPSIVESFIPQNNRSIDIPITRGAEDLGSLTFELFEGRVPRATSRMIELAESGFHDGVPFHRIIDGFMIQGGDPMGTGAGGSLLDDFDDQFHLALRHNSPGVLSMAKSMDDTNDSQFFIAEAAWPELDYNHSVFGKLVEGERTRETLSNVAVDEGALHRPLEDITMGAISVFEDSENAVLMLTALASTGGTTVTVTATDIHGNSASESFDVTLAPASGNTPPFLKDFDDPVLTADTPSFQVEAVDLEGSDVDFHVEFIDGIEEGTIAINEHGEVTVAGFVGTRQAKVTVEGQSSYTGNIESDSQDFTLTVAEPLHPFVKLSLAPTSENGDGDIEAIEELGFQEEFWLDVYVQDTSGGRGVFAAYVDVAYDPLLVETAGDIEYGEAYRNLTSGTTATSGLIDDVGAAASIATPTGSQERLLFRVPMRTRTSVGAASFMADPADLLPLGVVLYDVPPGASSTTVSSGQIEFLGSSLRIFDDSNLPPVANDDEYSTAIDTLLIVPAPGVLQNDRSKAPTLQGLLGSTPMNGSLTWSSDGAFEYSPNPGFSGLDSFTYLATNGLVVSAPATVTIRVEGGLPGDVDGNGSVDFADFLILSSNFSMTVSEGTLGDLDSDGQVAFGDFLILSGNFGKTIGE